MLKKQFSFILIKFYNTYIIDIDKFGEKININKKIKIMSKLVLETLYPFKLLF